MKLVVAEKNIAAQKIAQLLADAGAPKNGFFTQILHEETFALYTASLSWGL